MAKLTFPRSYNHIIAVEKTRFHGFFVLLQSMNNKCYIRLYTDRFEVVSYNFEEYDADANAKYNKDNGLYYGFRISNSVVEYFYDGGISDGLISEMEISTKLFHSIIGAIYLNVSSIEDKCQKIIGNKNHLHVPGATNYFIEYDGPHLTLNQMRKDNVLYTEHHIVLNEGFIYFNISEKYEEPYPFEFGGDEIYFIDQYDYYDVVLAIKKSTEYIYGLVESIFELRQ